LKRECPIGEDARRFLEEHLPACPVCLMRFTAAVIRRRRAGDHDGSDERARVALHQRVQQAREATARGRRGRKRPASDVQPLLQTNDTSLERLIRESGEEWIHIDGHGDAYAATEDPGYALPVCAPCYGAVGPYPARIGWPERDVSTRDT